MAQAVERSLQFPGKSALTRREAGLENSSSEAQVACRAISSPSSSRSGLDELASRFHPSPEQFHSPGGPRVRMDGRPSDLDSFLLNSPAITGREEEEQRR